MNIEEVVLKVVELLNRADIPYLITGALAVVYYGEPRTTHDIDVVVEIKEKDITTLVKQFEADFFIDEESIRAALRETSLPETSMANTVHKETGFKVDFWILGDDAFSRERFARRVKVVVLDTPMYLPTAEDVIVSKLEWFKLADIDKHYFDALGVYRIQGAKLDLNYIGDWCRQKNISEIWNRIQREK